MMNQSQLLLLVVVFGMIASMVNAQADKVCKVCDGGKDLRYPDEKLCQDFQPRTNGLFDTDNDCKDLQLEAYQKGCCPQPPFDHCDYCADGTPFNPDALVPSGQFVGGEKCFDYKYANSAMIGMFDDGTCDDTFLRRAGHYCGCPDQIQECWLCPDRQQIGNAGKTDGWATNSNCRGIEFLFSLLSKEECSSFPMDIGADLAIYCGCGGLNQTEIEAQQEIFRCELCRNGGFLVNPDLVYEKEGSKFRKTCQAADDFARDIIKTPSACNNPRYFDEARNACCSNGSGASSILSKSMAGFVAGALGLLAMLFV